MSDIDPLTGLPKELGTFEEIAKESQVLKVKNVKKKFGKIYTIISGFDTKTTNVRDISKRLKSFFACGGTAKGDTIELQGEHSQKVKVELNKMGYEVA